MYPERTFDHRFRLTFPLEAGARAGVHAIEEKLPNRKRASEQAAVIERFEPKRSAT